MCRKTSAPCLAPAARASTPSLCSNFSWDLSFMKSRGRQLQLHEAKHLLHHHHLMQRPLHHHRGRRLYYNLRVRSASPCSWKRGHLMVAAAESSRMEMHGMQVPSAGCCLHVHKVPSALPSFDFPSCAQIVFWNLHIGLGGMAMVLEAPMQTGGAIVSVFQARPRSIGCESVSESVTSAIGQG